jgi:hypothetical protein
MQLMKGDVTNQAQQIATHFSATTLARRRVQGHGSSLN